MDWGWIVLAGIVGGVLAGSGSIVVQLLTRRRNRRWEQAMDGYTRKRRLQEKRNESI